MREDLRFLAGNAGSLFFAFLAVCAFVFSASMVDDNKGLMVILSNAVMFLALMVSYEYPPEGEE